MKHYLRRLSLALVFDQSEDDLGGKILRHKLGAHVSTTMKFRRGLNFLYFQKSYHFLYSSLRNNLGYSIQKVVIIIITSCLKLALL